MTWLMLMVSIVLIGIMKSYFRGPGKASSLPRDIDRRIKKLYPDHRDYHEVLNMLSATMEDKNLSVGADQLIRSMLIIAEQDKAKLREIIDSNFYSDPRDVIMEAMAKPGNTNDHGMTSFED